ncbi:MAG TPA: type II toxin-antitoxin system RatA family toxin [Rhizomicrobium sp.]|jgi:coenzyme Q-binding protein COQ10
MTAFAESKIVPYTADLMYRIAADVERYPEFLPWIVAQRILRRERAGAHDVLLCETLVGFKNLRERYTSRATLIPEERRIDVANVDGVFRRMETHWRCTPEAEGCRVDFAIDFEFKSRVLGAIAGNIFNVAIARMTKAFQERARVLSAPSPPKGKGA